MNPIPEPGASQNSGLVEDADIGTSSDDYARRFRGAVGRWFLETQTRLTLELLRELPAGASVLDVGGGHAQIAPQLIEAGYEITVVGSDPVCAARLAPWTASGRCRFEVANLLSLPYANRSFDAVVCFRLLPHSVSWKALIGELCRVARRSVILDFPSTRSANLFSSPLFQLKRAIELNTREFILFNPSEINSAFRRNGFIVRKNRPQFLLPMVMHRWANQSVLSRVAETSGRLLGLTRWFGSPIIIRADRRTASA
ncbi:MAG: class I SAM-dependent methyltransferase [Gemmatimonadota bacterium]|nr:class I SAM-dependent methyltransferase [Gemmatimonadota bacterium]